MTHSCATFLLACKFIVCTCLVIGEILFLLLSNNNQLFIRRLKIPVLVNLFLLIFLCYKKFNESYLNIILNKPEICVNKNSNFSCYVWKFQKTNPFHLIAPVYFEENKLIWFVKVFDWYMFHNGRCGTVILKSLHTNICIIHVHLYLHSMSSND
jgi:hypothetical protein